MARSARSLLYPVGVKILGSLTALLLATALSAAAAPGALAAESRGQKNESAAQAPHGTARGSRRARTRKKLRRGRAVEPTIPQIREHLAGDQAALAEAPAPAGQSLADAMASSARRGGEVPIAQPEEAAGPTRPARRSRSARGSGADDVNHDLASEIAAAGDVKAEPEAPAPHRRARAAAAEVDADIQAAAGADDAAAEAPPARAARAVHRLDAKVTDLVARKLASGNVAAAVKALQVAMARRSAADEGLAAAKSWFAGGDIVKSIADSADGRAYRAAIKAAGEFASKGDVVRAYLALGLARQIGTAQRGQHDLTIDLERGLIDAAEALVDRDEREEAAEMLVRVEILRDASGGVAPRGRTDFARRRLVHQLSDLIGQARHRLAPPAAGRRTAARDE